MYMVSVDNSLSLYERLHVLNLLSRCLSSSSPPDRAGEGVFFSLMVSHCFITIRLLIVN